MSAVVFIPLTQGKVAVIDFEDFEKVRPYKWFAQKDRDTYYARRNRRQEEGKGAAIISLHRAILTPEPLEFVDHIDGDGLNNCRSNLRTASRSQNKQNQRHKKPGGGSQFKGVYWNLGVKKWIASIRVNRKLIHLGCFDSEEPAARAYDAAATKYFGEFAAPNFS